MANVFIMCFRKCSEYLLCFFRKILGAYSEIFSLNDLIIRTENLSILVKNIYAITCNIKYPLSK